MFLTTPQAVLQRMSLGSTAQGNITSAQSVLGAATPIVQNILGTDLNEATVTDYFNYKIARSRSRFAQYDLFLTRGFVNSEVDFTIHESNNGERVSLVDGNFDQVDPKWYDVDYDLGIVTMQKDLPVGAGRVAIVYSAGFGSDGDGVIQDGPEWLTQAAITACVNLLHSHIVAYNKIDVRSMSKGLHAAFEQLISSHIRPALNGFHPSSSIVRD